MLRGPTRPLSGNSFISSTVRGLMWPSRSSFFISISSASWNSRLVGQLRWKTVSGKTGLEREKIIYKKELELAMKIKNPVLIIIIMYLGSIKCF